MGSLDVFHQLIVVHGGAKVAVTPQALSLRVIAEGVLVVVGRAGSAAPAVRREADVVVLLLGLRRWRAIESHKR